MAKSQFMSDTIPARPYTNPPEQRQLVADRVDRMCSTDAADEIKQMLGLI